MIKQLEVTGPVSVLVQGIMGKIYLCNQKLTSFPQSAKSAA